MSVWLHHVGTAAAVVAACAAWTFVATYLTRPWWRYEEGRHLMCFTAVVAAIFTYLASRALMGSPVRSLHEEVARVLIYGSMAALLLWRVHLLRKAIRKG